MKSNYKRLHDVSQNVHFSRAMFGSVESSRMVATPMHITTFNAGELIPIYCREILPDENVSFSSEFVIRQTTLLTPTMGNMIVDIYAFFVPNRIVNTSWKAVEGENLSGSWTANSVSLAPLCASSDSNVEVPVGSVADFYGFPTQEPIPKSVLSLCHDLKFRGYVMIWNEFFRDQNYQPPIPISYLNTYQGFFDHDISGARLGYDNIYPSGTVGVALLPNVESDGSFGTGSINNELYGSSSSGYQGEIPTVGLELRFNALAEPLKVNKFHDYFTSVLPSPQKSQSSIFAPVTGNLNINIPSMPVVTSSSPVIGGARPALLFRNIGGTDYNGSTNRYLGISPSGSTGWAGTDNFNGSLNSVYPSNLEVAGASVSGETTGLALSVDDIRMASSIQQVYETLARGGSRYRELVSSFFGINPDNPYEDIPTCLGHIRRELDLYQTAQTSASESGNTPQGNLAAFGYTSNGGKLFEKKFIEHGYLHVFAVVRHKNLYSSYLARDNFRLNMLDFYTPPLANISEQPVYTREINPFAPNPNNAFGYQEAWAEYRYEPDLVSGYMRPGINQSLDVWNYADDFSSSLQIADGNWLLSNSREVLDRTLAVTSSNQPQFKGQFKFVVDKTLPMPIYSVPGMDII